MKTRNRGFTLVEILIVIAILCSLSALLIPMFARVREKGRETVCQSNVKQILSAFQMYVQDNDNHLPFGVVISNSQFYTWHDALLPYIKSKEIFVCPDDAHTSSSGDFPAYPTSYSANNTDAMLSGQTGARARLPVALSQVPKASSVVMIADGGSQTELIAPWVTTYSPQKLNCWYLAPPRNVSSGPGGIGTDSPDSTFGGPSLRHSGKSVVGFLDGHAKVMAPETWYYPDTPWLDWKRGG